MRAALIYHEKNQSVYPLLREVVAYLTQRGVEMISASPDEIGFLSTDLHPQAFADCDFCVVFGGDGTFLAAARCLFCVDVPFFSVNLGKIGFLTQVELAQVFPALDCFLHHKYAVKERIMLQASVFRSGKKIADFSAFNDIVVRSSVSRTIKLDLTADGSEVNTFNADGLILCTPAGSTGYSLSAGGPILFDELDVLLATPISARTFLNRAIVLPGAARLEVLLKGERDQAVLTADGQESIALFSGDQVEVCLADKKAKVIYFGEHDYFQRIKEKLYRSETNN